MGKQKTTEDFADWASKTLRMYEREIDKIATLVLAGVADTSLEEKTGALESLIVTFVYRHGTNDEKQQVLVYQNISGIYSILERCRMDKYPKQLGVVFQKIWDVYSKYLLSEPKRRNREPARRGATERSK